MGRILSHIRQFIRFYRKAVTKYQLHSPFVFDLAQLLLDDRRNYYAFSRIEALRDQVLRSNLSIQVRDWGTGADRRSRLSSMVRRSASSACQGRRLFRLANYLRPATILELGSSLGIGAMYLASGAGNARCLTLEGCPATAAIARTHFEWMGLEHRIELLEGPFEETLDAALSQLKRLDMVFVDGNHRGAATWQYFEKCLHYAGDNTVFVLDDMHWSDDMAAAWERILQHPRVTLSVDIFDLSLVFIHPDFRVKQHFNVVPAHWKIWKFL